MVIHYQYIIVVSLISHPYGDYYALLIYCYLLLDKAPYIKILYLHTNPYMEVTNKSSYTFLIRKVWLTAC